ncbi:PTS sugar transporter subunit IIA [Clostridium sp. BL-8]|uniref:PTS sugar transporter subunit IIA n=1 Tax=Clostridium sp. BL-8 TaxID=349938 RepID=UPI00098CC91D|nr:PTS sugar transporter subunit IIA [Clostridium sp. BL-8]OOM81579.1 nitrogen regulatory protein [Clostridium sp. BL-8]
MINTILEPENIFIEVEIDQAEKEYAVREISRLCSEKTGIKSEVLYKNFMDREALDSTGFGNGVAIPHAKVKNLKKPMIGIIKFSKPIEWDAIDGNPVNVVIPLIMPAEDENNLHLKIISSFARKLAHKEFIEKLNTEMDTMKLYKYIIKEVGE